MKNLISTIPGSPNQCSTLWVREFLENLAAVKDLRSMYFKSKAKAKPKALLVGANRCELDTITCAMHAADQGLLLTCFEGTKVIDGGSA